MILNILEIEVFSKRLIRDNETFLLVTVDCLISNFGCWTDDCSTDRGVSLLVGYHSIPVRSLVRSMVLAHWLNFTLLKLNFT